MGSTEILFLVLLGLVALSRVLELRKSKQHLEGTEDPGAVESHYVLMVATHTLLFVLPPLELIYFSRPFHAVVGGLSFGLVIFATVMRLWVIRTLGSAWNTRGLVKRDLQVVSDGPYRWMRHPNYLAVIVEIGALPLVHSCYWSALFLSVANALILAIRIPWEEKQLFELPGYREAFGDKPRLLPSLFMLLGGSEEAKEGPQEKD